MRKFFDRIKNLEKRIKEKLGFVAPAFFTAGETELEVKIKKRNDFYLGRGFSQAEIDRSPIFIEDELPA